MKIARYYRFRLPPWARKALVIIELAMPPLVIYQIIRTLILPTTLDIFILGLFIFVFIAFSLKWI